MLEKLAIRRSWNKISAEFATAKQDLAYLDNHLNVNPYSKAFYLSDCKKLTTIINRVLSNKKAVMNLMDKIVAAYPHDEAEKKIEAINDEVKFLERAVNHCKYQLERKQETYEPDKVVKRIKHKIRYDGGVDAVEEPEVERTPKSKEYDEMAKSTQQFHNFALDIDEYAFVSALVIP